MRNICLIVLLLISSVTYSQISKDVFPLTREFKRGGFYVSPLATFSIGNKEDGSYSVADTTYEFEVKGSGKLGYGIEVGWYHSFKEPYFIHYLEAGLSYRVFKGSAKHTGTLSSPLGNASFQSDNSFSNKYLVASLRAVNAKQLGKKSFLSTAIGVNFNYQLADSYEYSAKYPLNSEEFLNETSLQLHLQMGVGFRVSRSLIIMPTIETPLLTIVPSDNLNPSFPFLGTHYQPIIIGLRFMFIRADPMNCNAPTYQGVPN